MSDDATIGAAFPRAVIAGRLAAGVVSGGVLAALAWMFVLQEGHTGNIFGATWTDHDFADGLGNAVGARDTARTGLFLTLALGVQFAGLYLVLQRWLPGRSIVKGLAFAPIPFLAWGLVFTPLVDSRQVLRDADFVFLPAGVFGVGAGRATFVSGIVASLVAGVILARVIGLMSGAAWWQEHANVGHGLDRDDPAAALLELAEERPEHRVEGTR